MFKWLKMKKRKEQWFNLMCVMKMTGFNLVNMREIMNGHVLTISIPPTSSFKEFASKKESFQSYFKGIVDFEEVRFSNLLQMKIITNDIGKYEFEPIKPPSKTHIYVGKTFDGKPYFINLKTDAHILIAGKNGGGKSFELAIILANIIYFQSKLFDIYLCQTAKRDIDYLKDCKSIKSSVYTAEETGLILEKAFNEINRRAELFANMGVRGVDGYNEASKSKMKRKLYVFEEISLYMPDDTDSDEERKEKVKVWTLLWKMVKLGREVGINVFMLSQRTTAKNLGGDGEIKSQLARMTFYQAQQIDSMNVIDCDLATKLKELECYVLDTKGLTLLKVPYLSDGLLSLKKYVPEIIAYDKNAVQEQAITSIKELHRFTKEEIQVEFEHTPIDECRKTQENKPKLVNVEEKVDGNTILCPTSLESNEISSNNTIDSKDLIVDSNSIEGTVTSSRTIKKRKGVTFE